eukprot:1846738-Pyramimonas_sp.AAC.1
MAAKFLDTPCHQGLFRGLIMVPTKNTVNGTDLHSSHTLAYHKEFGGTTSVEESAARPAARILKACQAHCGPEEGPALNMFNSALGWKEQKIPRARGSPSNAASTHQGATPQLFSIR